MPCTVIVIVAVAAAVIAVYNVPLHPLLEAQGCVVSILLCACAFLFRARRARIGPDHSTLRTKKTRPATRRDATHLRRAALHCTAFVRRDPGAH